MSQVVALLTDVEPNRALASLAALGVGTVSVLVIWATVRWVLWLARRM